MPSSKESFEAEIGGNVGNLRNRALAEKCVNQGLGLGRAAAVLEQLRFARHAFVKGELRGRLHGINRRQRSGLPAPRLARFFAGRGEDGGIGVPQFFVSLTSLGRGSACNFAREG